MKLFSFPKRLYVQKSFVAITQEMTAIFIFMTAGFAPMGKFWGSGPPWTKSIRISSKNPSFQSLRPILSYKNGSSLYT